MQKDKNKQYQNQEAIFEIETRDFDSNVADFFIVLSNNKVVYQRDHSGV